MITNQQMSAAQKRYDDMEPPSDQDEFLDTGAGKIWLSDAIEELMDGKNHTFHTTAGFHRIKHEVTYADLVAEMADEEQGLRLEQLAARIATGATIPENSWDMACSDYKAKAREVAERLLSSIASDRFVYETQLSEDDSMLDGPW